MLPHCWQDDKENCSPQIPPQLPPTIRVRKGLRAQGDKENSLPQLPQQQNTLSERTASAVSQRRHELAHSRSPRTTRHLLLKQLGPSPSREALMAFVKRLSASERPLFLGGPPQTRLASTHGAPDQTVDPGPIQLALEVRGVGDADGLVGSVELCLSAQAFLHPLDLFHQLDTTANRSGTIWWCLKRDVRVRSSSSKRLQ